MPSKVDLTQKKYQGAAVGHNGTMSGLESKLSGMFTLCEQGGQWKERYRGRKSKEDTKS